MTLIDTHTHLYLPEFADEDKGREAVSRALAAGISHMVMPNVDKETLQPMKDLAQAFPQRISMAMGLHPTSVGADWRSQVQFVPEELKTGKYCAVGEIGIDLYWDKTYSEEQMQCLDYQLCLAEEYGLPAIIHCREGLEQTLEVLQGHPTVKAVFHSFGGTPEQVKQIRRTGDYLFGINGIVTFKNCQVKECLPEITLDRLLLETDSPYLAPVPYRGKRNESVYMVKTAEFIAGYLGLPLEAVASSTTANSQTFFNIAQSQ